MILGYRLRELRKQNNMSQDDLGKLLGVTKVSVSCYEKGMRVPGLDVLMGMSDIFGVSTDYLLGRELDVVCESDLKFYLSTSDIEIIKEIRSNPVLFNTIAANPKRFFSTMIKNNI